MKVLQEKVAEYREDGEIWFVIGFLPHTNDVDMQLHVLRSKVTQWYNHLFLVYQFPFS